MIVRQVPPALRRVQYLVHSAIAKTSGCRQAIRSTAAVTGPRAYTLPAAELTIMDSQNNPVRSGQRLDRRCRRLGSSCGNCRNADCSRGKKLVHKGAFRTHQGRRFGFRNAIPQWSMLGLGTTALARWPDLTLPPICIGASSGCRRPWICLCMKAGTAANNTVFSLQHGRLGVAKTWELTQEPLRGETWWQNSKSAPGRRQGQNLQ